MHAQVTDAAALADTSAYKRIPEDAANHRAGDTEYSNPRFHALLKACFRGRHGVYTVHDVAFADCMCFAHLTGENLQRVPPATLVSTYAEYVATAIANMGTHNGIKLGTDEESTIDVVKPKGTKKGTEEPTTNVVKPKQPGKRKRRCPLAVTVKCVKSDLFVFVRV